MHTGKKAFGVFFVLIIISFSLSAETTVLTQDQVTGYSISSYTFAIQGKTKEFALRKAIVPEGGDPIFSSEDEMIGALNGKEQQLLNMRIFSAVSYTYEFVGINEGVASYTVHFIIDDAFTLLPIPYVKYDNDTIGLRFGMKLYDKNLFGSFADLYMVGHVSQGNGELSNWDHREDYLEMTVSSLPLGSSLLGFTTKYSNTKNSGSNGTFSFDIDWTGLEIFGVPLNISPAATFNPSSDFSFWNPSSFELVTNFGPFRQDGAMYSLYNKSVYYYGSESLYTYTALNQLNLSIFHHPISFQLSGESSTVIGAENLDYLNLGTTVGTGFSFPYGFYLSSSIGGFLHYIPNQTPLKYSYLFSSSLNRSKINWKGNFRKGYSASLTYTTDLYPQEEYESNQYWQLEGHATWFLFASKHFNPAIRFTGFISDTKKAFLPSDSGLSLANYFRGILQSNDLLSADSDTYVAVLNMNLTMTFITLKNFAHTYASPFIDIGVLNDPANEGEALIIASAGAEGYVIFDKFPSFPIRGSLGVNLQDVKKAIDKDITMKDIEFEISIGMGLYF